jgi:nucleotide-binding universal stress UspA family protein
MEATRKIVVGVDNTETGARALTKALETAAVGARTEVHAIRVLEPVSDPLIGIPLASTTEELADLKEKLQNAIQKMITADGALKVAAVVAHVTIGAPARAIVTLAAQIDADLIVVGTHGRRGIRRAILGSVAEEVVRTAGCPVFAVRPKDHPQDARVPQVEPLCEQCAETRFATKNEKLWCAQHSVHHPRAHVYHYDERSTDAARPWGFDA